MEEAAARFPQRKAYEDETCSMTFSEVRRLAASIGTGIAALENPGRPVAVFMEKSVWMAVSLLGVSCGGFTGVVEHLGGVGVKRADAGVDLGECEAKLCHRFLV